MSLKIKKDSARSHSESQGCLCAICFEKTTSKDVDVSTEFESMIQMFGNPDFSLKNNNLPTSICGSCRLKLDRLSKVLISALK